MVEKLRRPEYLSTQVRRARIPSASDQPAMIDNVLFSGVGYVATGECTFEVVQVVDGVVTGPFDDPLFPSGPYVDLEKQPGYFDQDDSADWFYYGEPFTGVSLWFAPDGHLNRVAVVKNAIPVDEYSFDHSGVVTHRTFDQRFDRHATDGLSSIRQSLTWSPSGEMRRCLTSLLFDDTSARVSLSMPAKVSISAGYFNVLQQYRDQLTTSLPFIEDLTFVGELDPPGDTLQLGLGDRSVELVERMVAAGHIDAVKDLRVLVDSDGMAGLSALVALPLSAVETVQAAPAQNYGQAEASQLEVLKVLVALKRRLPKLEVRLDRLALRTVKELSLQQDAADALYFDDNYGELLGVCGPVNGAELLDYVVSEPSLLFVKMPDAIPLYQEMHARMGTRDDLILIEDQDPVIEWLPGVLSRLNKPTDL